MFPSSILGKVTHFVILNEEQKQAWEKPFFFIEWVYQSNLRTHITHSPENGLDRLISRILKLSAVFW